MKISGIIPFKLDVNFSVSILNMLLGLKGRGTGRGMGRYGEIWTVRYGERWQDLKRIKQILSESQRVMDRKK